MSQAEVKIVFRRKVESWKYFEIPTVYFRNIEFHLFGVFLQQMILILVGFLTYFFEVTNFSVSTKWEEYCMYFTIFMQDRVMVSLTLMLVIATITASIQMVR